ncbi:HNH endonuclease [Halanaerobacter jeridensis]|uniref:Restriction endonuclease n=1 Tax=Halanaerobacter jeridensis TaxID=706427 RepID=A0A938XW58_9FIRM|nr:HNH endonuclease [Halanaerobacter jeridensis]MBM7556727.1 putative restriction endonuclease [Halanaerobacter jeridensis]
MIAITPTDIDWFQFLKKRLNFQVINFWTDTPWNPQKLNFGDKFYFLLRSPVRKIAGYADFYYYQNLTIREAWQKFGRGNGVNSLYELGTKATGDKEPDFNTEIGCIVLQNPVFLDEDDYFYPADYNLSFSDAISKHKYFPQRDKIHFENDYQQVGFSFSSISADEEYQFNQAPQTRGQSEFRQNLFRYYNNQGVITKEHNAELLDAVHIHPHLTSNRHHPKNGILLRTDFHKLFDEGLITITPGYQVLVASQLESDYYHEYHNKDIYLPDDHIFYPDQQVLEFHNRYIFRDNFKS